MSSQRMRRAYNNHNHNNPVCYCIHTLLKYFRPQSFLNIKIICNSCHTLKNWVLGNFLQFRMETECVKVDVWANINVWNAGDLVKETAWLWPGCHRWEDDQLGRFSDSRPLSAREQSSIPQWPLHIVTRCHTDHRGSGVSKQSPASQFLSPRTRHKYFKRHWLGDWLQEEPSPPSPFSPFLIMSCNYQITGVFSFHLCRNWMRGDTALFPDSCHVPDYLITVLMSHVTTDQDRTRPIWEDFCQILNLSVSGVTSRRENS